MSNFKLGVLCYTHSTPIFIFNSIKIVFAFILLNPVTTFGQQKFNKKSYLERFESFTEKGAELYYLDTAAYQQFIRTEAMDSIGPSIYGYFINDSCFIRTPSVLFLVPGCSGVRKKELDRMDSIFSSTGGTLLNKLLINPGMRSVRSQQQYVPSLPNRKKMVIWYSHFVLRRYKRFYKDVRKRCDVRNIELIVLTLDPVAYELIKEKHRE